MSEREFDYDLIVIGSGPAGYRALMQASKIGKKVCMVEKVPGKLGGAWIHTGTIPSKTLRESMEQIHSIGYHAGSQWVDRIMDDLSTTKLLGRSRKVALYEEKIVQRYLDRYDIEVFSGTGIIEDANTVRVSKNDGEVINLTSSFILIGTGSRPRRPDNIPFDGWRVVDGDEILQLEHLPRSMIIYGGGVIGCEYACIFAALGVKTTLIDGRDKIMQFVDQEVVKVLRDTMEEAGVHFKLGHKLTQVQTKGPEVVIELDNGEKIQTDVLFFSAGRVPNTDRIGLDRIGIKTDERGNILVNENFQTEIPSIYAAGDCIGAPALAATSNVQGRHAACHMFSKRCVAFPKVFPVGVYTIPELSSVGLTEEELIRDNIPYIVGRAHYREVARGYIRGDEHGLLKMLICTNTHKILGIHIAGHDACNLIHTGLAFMLKDGHAQDFVDMVFNYPTLAEAFRIAAFNGLNKIFKDGEILDPPQGSDQVEVETVTKVKKIAGT
jgi:NAD(P) transhydrogenase